VVSAPRSGTLATRLKPGDVINPGTLVAHIVVGRDKTEVRSEVPGTILQWAAPDSAQVEAGQQMLLVDPSPEMVWESLRALYLIGRGEDLAAINRYVRGIDGMPLQIQQQAAITAREISSRMKQ
jgi:multidrug efflux pump subunit AcrA (membrane-fusion protein)